MPAMKAPGCVAPYTLAETTEASTWLSYIDGVLATVVGDPAAAIVEAIDKAQRRAGLSVGVAALLAEIFDVPHVDDPRASESG